MRLVIPLLASSLLAASFASPAPARAAPEDSGTLRLGGSTTLLPIVATAASVFMEQYKTWDRAGAGLPKKDTVIFVSGGGSGFGARSAINGTVDIGLISRDLKDEEKRRLGRHETYLIGRDAVAIATNRKSPLAATTTGFTTGQAARIFAGELKTFRDVDPKLPGDSIVLLVRDAGAGSAELMQELVLGTRTVSRNALQLPSQGALLKKLESNAGAVAYISSGLLLTGEELKGYALDGVMPTNENVLNGSYKLARPLLMVVKGSPGPTARRFIDYMLQEGQKIVAEHAYVPARAAGAPR